MEYRIEADSSLGMKVPVTIYADEVLMKKMMTDRTIKQAINVATLPGILQHAVVLPDGHEFKISKFTRSRKDVLRGLHGDDETWKYISCVYGEIYQVVVDNRPKSETYLKWEGFIISDRNHLSVLVPPGFVNGHLCLSADCVFHYAQSYPSNYVDVERQEVLKWNDVRLGIDWPTGVKPILSERDR